MRFAGGVTRLLGTRRLGLVGTAIRVRRTPDRAVRWSAQGSLTATGLATRAHGLDLAMVNGLPRLGGWLCDRVAVADRRGT